MTYKFRQSRLSIVIATLIAGAVGITIGLLFTGLLINEGSTFNSYDTYASLIYAFPELTGLLIGAFLEYIFLRYLRLPNALNVTLSTVGLSLLLAFLLWFLPPTSHFFFNLTFVKDWWYQQLIYDGIVPIVATVIVLPITAGIDRLYSQKGPRVAHLPALFGGLILLILCAYSVTRSVQLVQDKKSKQTFITYAVSSVPGNLPLIERFWSYDSSQSSTITNLRLRFGNGIPNEELTIEEFNVRKTKAMSSKCGPETLTTDSSNPSSCEFIGKTNSGRDVYGTFFPGYPTYIEMAWVTIGNTRIAVHPPHARPNTDIVLKVVDALRETPTTSLRNFEATK